jgi:KaiC/GvpD/RAD55 family RecA-like ATPase
MMLWAAPGVGKTMLGLSMALAVAGGGEFIGWRAETARRVLLVDGEMATEDLQERLDTLRATIAGFDATAAGSNLHILARQDQKADSAFPNIASIEGQEAVMRAAAKHGAELVIADNFSTLAEVEDENDAAAMNPVLAWLLRMKQARLACILVHHSGKTGTSYRGSSKLAATFEVILGLKPPDRGGVAQGAAFTTLWDKFRGRPHPALRPRDIVLAQRPDGSMEWGAKEAEGDEVRQLVEAVRSGAHRTQRQVAEALAWDPAKVTRVKGRAMGEKVMTEPEWRAALAGGNAAGSTEF